MTKFHPHRRNYNDPGHAHLLTFSCFHGHRFLEAERTCEWLGDAIASARVEFDFDVWAFVFMPEHAHVIVHPRQAIYDIAKIRGAIKEPVGRNAIAWLRENAPAWLDRIRVVKSDRVRYCFWQRGGGHDRNVITAKTLLNMIDYVHMNPVRRKLVERAEYWKWSSAAWYFGLGDSPIPIDPIPPEWLLMD